MFPKKYDPKEAEPRIEKLWKEKNIFKFDPESKKPIFSIDTPPRYASGPLHIGHAVSYSHQDFVSRYKRLKGFNVFYPLCFDVNGMPIEVNVEKKGIDPERVGREEFIKACSEFANSNIKTMIKQFERLGFSMDDSIYYQTDAEYYRRLTQISFIRLYKKGLIYKGEAPVIWCPRCKTAIAEAEIEYTTRTTKLNYIKFYVNGDVEPKGEWMGRDENGTYIIIATTRPELLPGCVSIAVNPNDERYRDIVGKKVRTPIFNKEIEVTEDESVLMDFGTGIVMICTIGDKDDMEFVLKRKLPFIRVIDENGILTDVAGKYSGMGIEEARKKIIEDMKEQGLIVKQEDLEQNVGTCWRCHTPVEFIVTKEWFLKILDFKKEVLDASKKIKWFPEYMEKRLIDWVNSLSWDWCISRRRYLATPVPVWECEKCGEVVLAKEEQCYVDPLKDKPPIDKCPKCGGKLKGSELVFDTWMDSSLSPLYNSFWERDEKMFNKLYPMDLRPQSHDIIRTWAYYTILRSILLVNEIPFKNIVISGFIMGPDGRPMHASRGNVVDPLDVVDKYGADALRYFSSLCNLGEDTAFRWKDVEHASRLMTKLWNISRFLSMNIEGFNKGEDIKLRAIDKWILTKLERIVKKSEELLDNYRWAEFVPLLESFIWNDVADNYLELIKYRLFGDDVESKKAAQFTLYKVILDTLIMFSPVMPHITEEIYQNLFKDFEGKDSINLLEWPEFNKNFYDEDLEKKGEIVKKIAEFIRRWKHDKGLPLNSEIKKLVIDAREDINDFIEDIKGVTKAIDLEFGEGIIEVSEDLKISID